jgi:hypothetical protein
MGLVDSMGVVDSMGGVDSMEVIDSAGFSTEHSEQAVLKIAKNQTNINF